MSYTFTLTGKKSNVLSMNLHPALELNPNKKYALALIGLHTFNSIPNIDERANKFYYREKANKDVNGIIIPTGSYEISDIEKFLQQHLQERLNIERNETTDSESLLSLKPNNNTLKCEIKSKLYEIDFRPSDSIGSMLGFSKKVLSANQLHESDNAVNIIKVLTIRLECNLVVGSYYQGRPTHTLFQFSPEVNPGYSINIEPRNLIYLPVHERRIDNITIVLLDQNSQPVNFRDEEIVIRLELKSID